MLHALALLHTQHMSGPCHKNLLSLGTFLSNEPGKHGEQSSLVVILRVRTHQMVFSLCCPPIGQKNTKGFLPNQERVFARPFGTGPYSVCPQGLLFLVCTFCSSNFFPPVLTLSPAPLTAPGSPRMYTSISKLIYVATQNVVVLLLLFYNSSSQYGGHIKKIM